MGRTSSNAVSIPRCCGESTDFGSLTCLDHRTDKNEVDAAFHSPSTISIVSKMAISMGYRRSPPSIQSCGAEGTGEPWYGPAGGTSATPMLMKLTVIWPCWGNQCYAHANEAHEGSFKVSASWPCGHTSWLQHCMVQLGHPRNTIPILANEGRSNACGRGIIKKKGDHVVHKNGTGAHAPSPPRHTPTTAHILAPAQRLERRNSSTGTFHRPQS